MRTNIVDYIRNHLDMRKGIMYNHRKNTINTGAKMNITIPEACCSLDIEGEEQERLITMFKALGNPTRFEIMKFLITHPGCINGDIVEYLPIAQATVSQHLKVLRDSGFIAGTVEGTATSYCLNEENITWFRKKVGEIF